MECARKDTCINHEAKCYRCAAMADMYNHYPYYADKDVHRDRLTKLLTSKPELLKNLNISTHKIFTLVNYLIENGVRVEGDT